MKERKVSESGFIGLKDEQLSESGFIGLKDVQLSESGFIGLKDEQLSESGFIGLKDEQDLNTKKILKSSNLVNPDSDNMKQGWEIKKLGEVTSILGDGLHGTPKYTTEGEYHFINGNNLTEGLIELKENTKRVSIEEYNKYKKNLTDRTVLVSINGTLGNVAFYNDEKIILGKSACYFNLKDSIDKYFVKYVLTSPYFLEYAHKEATGATIKNVSLKTMRDFQIPLPPLPEQQRIVAILDEAFAAIAKAKANAQQNLQNAKDLFESYVQGVFENGNWEKVRFSELAKDITDGDHMPPPKSEEGFPFITISNINKQNRQIDFSDTFKVPKEYFDKLKENRKPKKGDVLYTVTGSYGIPVLIEDDFEFCFQRHIGLIRPKENVSSKWIYYWILSPNAFFQANDTATGTAQKTVSLTALRNFVLPKMTLKEQQAIVQKLDALQAETKKLEGIYQQKLNDLEELKKSVLQKAFSGELSESGLAGLKDKQDFKKATV